MGGMRLSGMGAKGTALGETVTAGSAVVVPIAHVVTAAIPPETEKPEKVAAVEPRVIVVV